MPELIILQAQEAAAVLREIAATLQPAPPDQFLNLRDAARELGVTPETLSALAHGGKIPCRNLGTAEKANFRFSKNALSAWMAGKK